MGKEEGPMDKLIVNTYAEIHKVHEYGGITVLGKITSP